MKALLQPCWMGPQWIYDWRLYIPLRKAIFAICFETKTLIVFLSVVLSWHSIFVYNMDICFVIYLYFSFRVLLLLITSELSCQIWLIWSDDYIHQPINTVGTVSNDTALAYFEYKLSKSRVFERYLDRIQCPHFPLGQQNCDLLHNHPPCFSVIYITTIFALSKSFRPQ